MLPPEILDQIFSFLTTDKASLKACSNAHPVFFHIIQPYLFADVAISSTGDSGSFQAKELLTLLSENPHVSNYILRLKISIPEPSHHVAVLNTISTILHLPVRLTSISFIYQSYARSRILWNELPESFLTAFMTCLRLPSMKTVSLTNIRSLPLTIFDDFPNIKTIRLINVDVLPHSNWEFDVPQPPLQILSVFDCEGAELPQILFWARTRHLHSLEFRPQYPIDLSRIIIHCRAYFHSLTTLDLDFKGYFQTTFRTLTGQIISDDSPIIPLHLAGFSNLERVTVHSLATVYDVHPSTSEAQYSWCLHAIAHFFRSGYSRSPKHITLHFRISIYGLTPLSDLNWSALNLDSSSLQHIVLRVSATAKVTQPGFTTDIPPATILSSLSQSRHIMGLVEKGFLTIEPCIDV